MPAAPEDAKIEWRGDVPVSTDHADPYYSLTDGLAETGHVFLDGNDLARRFREGGAFRIAELGFGTGLSFLLARRLWLAEAPEGATLTFTSFEIAPLPALAMARALAAWPELADLAHNLLGVWTGGGEMCFGRVTLHVVTGDARDTVPAWAGTADAWFLDGFAPARNPEMWEPELLAAVARHTSSGGTFSTYSAAGHVRRALADAGFVVERRPGYGTKRHMTVGRLT